MYVFYDEIQHLKNWEAELKSLCYFMNRNAMSTALLTSTKVWIKRVGRKKTS